MNEIELTGIKDIDNIIHDFKGSIELFTEPIFLKKSSLYLQYYYGRKLDKISSIDNLKWEVLYKLNNGHTIFIRRHCSYAHLMISFIITFVLVFIVGGALFIQQEKLQNIHWILGSISIILLAIYTTYHMFFCEDIVIISFNGQGISLYKGTLILPIKRLYKSTFTYEELPLIVKKCKYMWQTHAPAGWGATLIDHYGFASIILINETQYNEFIEFENHHQESDVCSNTIHQKYIDDKILVNNVLNFPFRFEAYGENDNKILEGVQVKLISTL